MIQNGSTEFENTLTDSSSTKRIFDRKLSKSNPSFCYFPRRIFNPQIKVRNSESSNSEVEKCFSKGHLSMTSLFSVFCDQIW